MNLKTLLEHDKLLAEDDGLMTLQEWHRYIEDCEEHERERAAELDYEAWLEWRGERS